MDWDSDLLYNKAKLYAERAHEESVDSALFGLWMSLSLELLARAAISHTHPVLLADPQNHENILYAFGVVPKTPVKSVPAKALFTRCSLLVNGFTDKMSVHCLIVAERRNEELHSGIAAFENIDNAKWLPMTYEVMEVLLAHLGRDFPDFLGEYSAGALESLKDREANIKQEVQKKIGIAKSGYEKLSSEEKTATDAEARVKTTVWRKESRLRQKTSCPACGNESVVSGEVVGRSPVRIDEDDLTISREVRVLPNKLQCAFCGLLLTSFQELREAERGTIYVVYEVEEPIEFFGIDPEEHINIDDLMRRYAEDYYGYNNE